MTNTVAFDNIDRQNVIIIFVEATMDRTKDPTGENYDRNLLSE